MHINLYFSGNIPTEVWKKTWSLVPENILQWHSGHRLSDWTCVTLSGQGPFYLQVVQGEERNYIFFGDVPETNVIYGGGGVGDNKLVDTFYNLGILVGDWIIGKPELALKLAVCFKETGNLDRFIEEVSHSYGKVATGTG